MLFVQSLRQVADWLPGLLYSLACVVGFVTVAAAIGVGIAQWRRASRRPVVAGEQSDAPSVDSVAGGRSGQLIVREGASQGLVVPLRREVTKVGRESPYADVLLEDAYISNPHFMIVAEGRSYYIVDASSTNGTRVNGAALPPQQRVPIEAPSMIEAGQTRLEFVRAVTEGRELDGSPFATAVLDSGDS